MRVWCAFGLDCASLLLCESLGAAAVFRNGPRLFTAHRIGDPFGKLAAR
jgi:hypothetical protein